MTSRKKATSEDADIVLAQLLQAVDLAHAGNRKRWVQLADLDFPYTPTQTQAAISVAAQFGWLLVGGKPQAHSVMMTEAGLAQIAKGVRPPRRRIAGP